MQPGGEAQWSWPQPHRSRVRRADACGSVGGDPHRPGSPPVERRSTRATRCARTGPGPRRRRGSRTWPAARSRARRTARSERAGLAAAHDVLAGASGRCRDAGAGRRVAALEREPDAVDEGDVGGRRGRAAAPRAARRACTPACRTPSPHRGTAPACVSRKRGPGLNAGSTSGPARSTAASCARISSARKRCSSDPSDELPEVPHDRPHDDEADGHRRDQPERRDRGASSPTRQEHEHRRGVGVPGRQPARRPRVAEQRGERSERNRVADQPGRVWATEREPEHDECDRHDDEDDVRGGAAVVDAQQGARPSGRAASRRSRSRRPRCRDRSCRLP